MSDGETLDSLGPLEGLVESELDFQQRHFESLDTKAGIVLGFSAALVALAVDSSSSIRGVGSSSQLQRSQGTCRLCPHSPAFWPRGFEVLDVAKVRDDSLGRLPDSLTRVAILDTYVQTLDSNRDLRMAKATRLKAGLVLLFLAVILLGAATVVLWLGGIT
ncbi:MAG: hypothetical protein R3320_11035 [Nitriliruptorales bacterium]|nr:hypothetical protein [Nitriliruptorales bacterium]